MASAPAGSAVRLPPEEIPLLASVYAMADRRAPDAALIERGLSARGVVVRRAAALAIGQSRAGALAPRLRALLADPDTSVAATAAFALGLLRDSASVTALDSALTGAPTVAAEAAWALGEIASDEARGVVERRLTERSLTGPPLYSLLVAAAKLRPVPVAQLAPYLLAEDPETAWRAAYGLGRNRAPAAVRPLVVQVLARDQRVREHVARGLARSAAGDSLADEAIAALDLLTLARDPHVRINAITSLATYGARARNAILAAVRDGDPNVRVAAARLVPEVLEKDLARWAWLWDADSLHAYRRAVLEGAVRAGVLLPALGLWSDSPDWREREAVASAVAAGEGAQALQWVRGLLRDPDPRVRAAAIGTASRHGDSIPEWRARLHDALADSSAFVRTAALQALVRRASASDAELALQGWLADQRRSTGRSDLRVAALRVIASAWRRDSLAFDDSLRFALATLPPPRDPRERAAARSVTPLAGWPSIEPEAPPPGWYEGIVRTLVEPALRGTLPVVEIRTERGTLVLELMPVDAPLTVHNFLELARSGFYTGTNFHRVVPNFVAQDGDPRGDARGGPGYTIRDELNRRRYGRGVVGMALSGPDTGGSQYFITHSAQPHLDGGYTVFGRVRDGMDVLDAIVQHDRILEVVVR